MKCHIPDIYYNTCTGTMYTQFPGQLLLRHQSSMLSEVLISQQFNNILLLWSIDRSID